MIRETKPLRAALGARGGEKAFGLTDEKWLKA